jgi:WD40 repeat protein
VTSVQEAQEIYQKILQVAQSASVCEMTWQSVVCEADSKINVEATWQGKSAQSTYIPPSTSIASLNVSPAFTVFGIQAPTSSTDKTITLTAQNADFTVTGITATFGSPDITVVNTNFPLLIPKNTSVSVTLRFIPSDSTIKYTGFEITSDKCPAFFSAKGGIPWGKIPNPTIKLISPNGGETFVAGSDTLITWDSIPKSDTVTLEYSSNNGITWNTNTTAATDLHYLWKNIPLPASNQCKIRVKQLSPNSGTSSKIGSLLFSLPGFSDRLVDVSWSPDGTKVASSFWNQDVLVWDALTGSKIHTLQGHTPPVSSVSWSPDGTRIVTVSRDVNVNFWNAATGAKLYSIPVSNDCKTPIWSPDSKKFVTASNDTFFVWSADFGYKILTVKCGLEVINDIKVVKWSPDGTKIAVGFSNPGGCYSPELPDSASVWSATTGKKLFALNGHLCGFGNRDPSGIQSLNWSPDGSKIATGGVDHSAVIWSGVTGAKLFTLTAHGYPVGVVSWSPDGTKVATASFNYGVSNDGVVIVWSATSGAMHYALRDHYGEISGISWNPEGTKIATASHDKSVIIWSAANGAKLLYFKAFIPGYGSGNKDYGAHWSPDGTRIAIGGDSSATNIWLVDDLPTTLQEDESDAVFSIVTPKAESQNIDLKQCLVNSQKDTMVASFVNNIGSYKCRIDSLYFTGTDASAFAVVSGLPIYELHPGDSKATEFKFSPTRTGLHTATINIVTQSETLQQTITGEGIAPTLAIVNNLIDFGKVVVNSSKDTLQAITIKNIGSAPLTITATRHAGPNDADFTTLNSGNTVNIAPGDTGKIDLQFSPKDVGRTSGRLLFDYNGIGSPATVVLYGEGIIKSSITSTAEITFDSVCIGQSKTLRATVTNEGGGDMQLLRAEWVTNKGNVFVIPFTPQLLREDSSITVDINFRPITFGIASGEVRWVADKDTAFSVVSGIGFKCLNGTDTARTFVSIPDITAQAGEKVNLTLKLQKPTGMEIIGAPTEWYARIHYNKSILYNLQTDNQCLGTTDSCMLELSGVYDPKTDELISIPCITTLGTTDHSTIVIDTFYWKNSAIVTKVATQNGSITLNGICEDGGVRLFIPAKNSTSLSTRPNPAQDNLQIQYGLREPLSVTLELLTMTGQVAQTILTTQSQVAGQYTLTTNLSLMGNGVYLLRLRTNKEILTTRVDVVK